MKESSGSLRSVLDNHRPCNGDDPTEENNEMIGGWTHERNIAEIPSVSISGSEHARWVGGRLRADHRKVYRRFTIACVESQILIKGSKRCRDDKKSKNRPVCWLDSTLQHLAATY
jgi:hypothetical protein